ncbi:MAG: mechanosensitive ion channel domain-containing protein [Xanthobacteraceae bacterium]
MFESISNAFGQIRGALDWAPDGVVAVVILALAVGLSVALHGLVTRLLERVAAFHPYARSVLTGIQGPTRLAFIVIALFAALPAAPLDPDSSEVIARLLLLTVIGLIGWAAITALNTTANIYLLRFRVDTDDNLLARKHVTQVRILLRTLDALLIIITVSAALMTFEPVRQYGVSLFASAGVAGLVVGLAARPVLSNLLAGVQLAVTQPIRMDDVVVVEGEWGRIEEITATYVVVRVWDLRRLIVPLTYFIEKPFQNWTREGAAILAPVLLYLDYTAPLDRIREKAKEFTEQSPRWNRQVFNVQVTDAKEATMEVRVLVSANTASAAWDLRCELREKLIDFLQRDYPQALPRRRQEIVDAKMAGAIRAELQQPPA